MYAFKLLFMVKAAAFARAHDSETESRDKAGFTGKLLVSKGGKKRRDNNKETIKTAKTYITNH